MAALRLVARKLIERPLPRIITSDGRTATTPLRRLTSSTESSELATLTREVNAKSEELMHLVRRLEQLRATELDVLEQTRRPPRHILNRFSKWLYELDPAFKAAGVVALFFIVGTARLCNKLDKQIEESNQRIKGHPLFSKDL